MVDVIKALTEHSEAGAAIVDLLYGDGAFEISKAVLTAAERQAKTERTQQRVAQVSNVVGLGAGLAATPGAIAAVRPAYRRATGKPELGSAGARKLIGTARNGNAVSRRVARGTLNTVKALNKPKTALALAGGGAALQAGNVGGDVVTGMVLNRQNKRDGVKKSAEEVISKGDNDVEFYSEISKVDEDKRQIFGWASVTSVNGVQVEDLQNDAIDLVEIEKAAYDYVRESRKGGNMHQKNETGPVHVSDMIESFVVTPEKRAAMGLPDSVPDGWWTGYQIHDDKTWQDVKDGKLVGLSIHGVGKRREV